MVEAFRGFPVQLLRYPSATDAHLDYKIGVSYFRDPIRPLPLQR